MRIKCTKCSWWHRKDLPCRAPPTNTPQGARKPRVNEVLFDDSYVFHGEAAVLGDEVACAEARLQAGDYSEDEQTDF